jgi:pimeloyl-ACP methyl ester carboxylesterase
MLPQTSPLQTDDPVASGFHYSMMNCGPAILQKRFARMGFPLNYHLRKLKRGALARLAILSRRFDPLLKTEAPLVRIEYLGSTHTRNLVIFLPGIGDVAEDFERSGFIEEMRRHRIAADAVAVDAHYGYYASRAIHARIAEDVIDWARAAGYKRIWLAGISLGGFGAISYAALHHSHIDGLLLFAPYLGDPALIGEIAAAGGVGRWEPGAIEEDDYQRALWAWLKEHVSRDKHSLPIYLGYGESDIFAKANALLAELLPGERVYLISGRHDWRTWKRLWHAMLPKWKPAH